MAASDRYANAEELRAEAEKDGREYFADKGGTVSTAYLLGFTLSAYDSAMREVADLKSEIQSHENVNNLLSEQLTDMEQQRDAWRDDATSYQEERDQWRRNAHAWREKMLAVYTQLTEQINEGVD